MAIRGREWSALDKEVSRRFNTLRHEQGDMPLREIAEKAGLTYSRLRDIMVGQNGTPTVLEFTCICGVFGVDPSNLLADVRKTISQESAPQDKPASSNAYASALSQLQRVTGRDPVQWTRAAYHDPDKNRERESGE